MCLLDLTLLAKSFVFEFFLFYICYIFYLDYFNVLISLLTLLYLSFISRISESFFERMSSIDIAVFLPMKLKFIVIFFRSLSFWYRICYVS